METTFNQTDPLTKSRKCIICGKEYTIVGKSFLGKLECREHASAYIAKIGKKYVWPCCGVESSHSSVGEFYNGTYSIERRGCVRCDHKDGDFTPYCRRPAIDHAKSGVKYTYGDPDVVIPKEVIERGLVDPEASQTKPLTAYRTVVYLFDRAEAEKVNKNRPKFERD